MLEEIIPNDYLRTLAFFLVLLFVIRLVLFIVEKILVKLTSKTKTELDDELIRRMSKPLTFLSVLISLYISIKEFQFVDSVQMAVNNSVFSLIIVVVAVIIYIVVDVLVITAIKKAAKKTKTDIDDSLISLFHSALKIAFFIVTFLYILSEWGIEIMPLLAGLGVAGLAVALALQPILSNIFSGASVVLDRSIRVGDLIYLDTAKGKIEKIGLRSTKVRTFDNELLIIPNNKLAEGIIQNVALPEKKSRATVVFGVSYGSDIDKVKKLVLKEIKKIDHIEKDPEPIVRFIEMADSALNFKAFFYVDSYDNRYGAIDEANTRIYNALNRAGIEIPFPQLDVHLKKK